MRSALALVLVLCAGTAAADTRKVEVTTDPPGATIYLGDLDSGTACEPTPCSVNAPAGKKTPVIARKDGYAVAFGVIDLRKSSVKTVSLELTPTAGTLVFDDPALAGGTISVDDVEKGKAPAHVQVEAAGHHVVVTVRGRAMFDDFVKVTAGEDYTVKPNKSEPAPLPPKDTPTTTVATTDPDTDIVGNNDSNNKVTKSADTGQPRQPSIVGGVVSEIGFRQFSYDHPQNLPPTEDEGGQILIGPTLQVWPMRLFGSEHLRGLSLYGKVGFGVNHEPVVQSNMPTGASTFWGNIEVDLQQRWNLGDTVSIEIGGGFVRDQLQYSYNMMSQIADVPYADYKSLRLGVRTAFRFGPIEPFVQIEGRIPFSEGVLATRFASADVTGAGASGGIAGTFGPVVARLEASIVYYSWTLTNAATGAGAETADGATDIIEGISLVLGVGY
jgi:hypothetical protein